MYLISTNFQHVSFGAGNSLGTPWICSWIWLDTTGIMHLRSFRRFPFLSLTKVPTEKCSVLHLRDLRTRAWWTPKVWQVFYNIIMLQRRSVSMLLFPHWGSCHTWPYYNDRCMWWRNHEQLVCISFKSLPLQFHTNPRCHLYYRCEWSIRKRRFGKNKPVLKWWMGTSILTSDSMCTLQTTLARLL